MFRYIYLGMVLGFSFSGLPFFCYLVYWALGNFLPKETYSAIGMTTWFVFAFLPYFIYTYYPMDEVTRKRHSPILYFFWFTLAIRGVIFVVYLWPGFWLVSFFGLRILNYVELLDESVLLSHQHPEEADVITLGKFKLMILCMVLGALSVYTPFYEFFMVFVESF